MSNDGCYLDDVARLVRAYFFPRKLAVPDHVWEMLGDAYPTIDWDRVYFYEGWPHMLSGSDYRAITLPDPHSLDRVNIYFKSEAWQPDTPQGLSILVHEGYHVLQVQEMWGGYGPGLVRPFLAAYLACWAANGCRYSGHPMEESAYRIAGRPSARFERHLQTSGTAPTSRTVAGADLQETELDQTFWQRMRLQNTQATAVGGSERSAVRAVTAGISALGSVLWTTGLTAVLLLLWLLWLFVEAIGLVAVGVTSLLSYIGCGPSTKITSDAP